MINRPIAAALIVLAALSAPSVGAQTALSIKALAEKKVTQLPAGPLFWRIERFDSLEAATAAAGDTALAATSRGQAWLFTLGPAGGATTGALKVAEVGPITPVQAGEYLLRINEASGPPGSVTSVHSHPGSEAFYVLSGVQRIRTGQGALHVHEGHPEAGPGAGTPLEVSNGGDTDLHALVMFLVDAAKPFSTPATLP